MDEQAKKLQQAAQTILYHSRKKLALDHPAFVSAVYLLPEQECPAPGPLWTDGRTLYYHPATVVADFSGHKNAIANQMLHIIAHGLLGHFRKRLGQEDPLFDASADLKATAFLEDVGAMDYSRRTIPRETFTLLRDKEKLSLEAIYLSPSSTQQAQEMVDAAMSLKQDDHRFWCQTPPPEQSGQFPSDGSSDIDALWETAQQQAAESLDQQGYGTAAGELSDTFREVDESAVSYREFLQDFITPKELQEIDPDSINRLWYHVGLSLTGDTPLVEPDETREDAPALKLILALDTSGSCSGSVMTGFLNELLSILRDGGRHMELTLIQCDAEIQNVQAISRDDCVEEILSGYEAFGWGGTDFRPVFDYADRLQQDGEAVRGLLYLSDGFGSFPEERPNYPVAFLFPREEEEDFWTPDIPDWVTQVRITEENQLKIKQEAN